MAEPVNNEQQGSGPESPSTGGRAAVAERPAPTRGPVDMLPPFKVLLHNDDVNSLEHVVETIVELTPLDHNRAVHTSLEAHVSGVALLLVTHKERAELYKDQFESKKLTVTIEPSE
ncbi:MAG: ATP-dependent Clp protease adaptor ClpS [Phycisphaerales bacterium]|nr:ATP-dependent Clp protease adaptor ClpS [Planctomycetota bacterium]